MSASALTVVLAVLREAFRALGEHGGGPGASVAVGLSGGRDSTTLLDALATLAPELAIELSAIHVHHGLSPNADAWAGFCADACGRLGVPLTVRHVIVRRAGGESLEAAARAARYAEFATLGTRFVALAHHADDQAETVLLQLLRGAGPAGLAAMPTLRASAAGPSLLRPFLALPRRVLEAYAAARRLEFVDDESNVDTRRKRNFLRREIAPRLASAFPGYPATLARVALHQADAAELADALAALDASAAIGRNEAGDPSLDRAALVALAGTSPARARNLLRWFLRDAGLAAPSSARLAEMLDQILRAAPDARVRLAHEGVELGVHRGRVIVHRPPLPRYGMVWNGEASIALPHGALAFTPTLGRGIAQSALANAGITIGPRFGGERIRLAADGPRRTLKRLLHDAGLPPWQRDAYPLVFRDGALVAIPGIGVDAAFQAAPGAPGYEVRWHPIAPASASASSIATSTARAIPVRSRS